jgi:hypothetical protein
LKQFERAESDIKSGNTTAEAECMQEKIFLSIFTFLTLLTLLTFLTSSSLRSCVAAVAFGCVAAVAIAASLQPQPPHTHFTGNIGNQPDLI